MMVASDPNSINIGKSYGTIQNTSDIIKYLVSHGGWAKWRKFVDRFKIKENFSDLTKWLAERHKHDQSFIGKQVSWIRPVYYENKESRTSPNEASKKLGFSVSLLAHFPTQICYRKKDYGYP